MIRRVGYLSMHTSPLAQPGTGYAGGMNVYINELAETMADRDVEVVVFTRRTNPDQPPVVVRRRGYRVVHIDAGPIRDVRPDQLAPHVEEFARGVIEWQRHRSEPNLEIVHSHYWLSGWGGVLVKKALGVPLVNSFHTLGRVKDRTRRSGEPPVPPIRTLTEDEVLARSDAVVASTPHEVADLIDHYGADPARLHLSPPGVDHIVFSPGSKQRSREWLGLGAHPILLVAGRIEPHKGIDIAVQALAKLPERVATGVGRPRLLVVGGPSGQRGEREMAYLRNLAGDLAVEDRIRFVPPQPHAVLADFYRAADLLVMPSRNESFGLVAAEAQACGLPVVASDAGGLRHVVTDGASGVIVPDLEGSSFADAAVTILDDPDLALRLSHGAVDAAEKFSWRATARRLIELYAAFRR